MFEKKEKKYQIIQYLIALGIIVIVCALDQITKTIALANLKEGETITFIPSVVGWFLARNTGAAWSILSDHHWILVVISFLAIGFLSYLMKNIDFSKKGFLYAFSLSLIFGGALGNLIDRVIYYDEGVVDFIRLLFMDFPIFNLADTFLTIGTILLIIYVLFFYKQEEIKKAALNNPKQDEGESPVLNVDETKNIDSLGDDKRE